MTRKELKAHCLKEIENCEMWARLNGEERYRKIYEEHELILELLEHEPRWIFVSEGLPEDSGEYLVTVVDKEDEDYKHIGVAWFAHPKDYDIKDGEWRELMIDEKVIAWMPLPEPFEPQESEDNNA